MRRLLILRHASAAAQGEAPGDRERPLSARGRREAERLKAWFEANAPAVDAVICSPSRRTVETWEALAGALPDVEIRFAERLYLGTPDDYLEEAGLEDAASVMIVGHNPTCASIAAAITPADRHDGRFAPATLCIANRQDDRWMTERIVRPADLSDER